MEKRFLDSTALLVLLGLLAFGCGVGPDGVGADGLAADGKRAHGEGGDGAGGEGGDSAGGEGGDGAGGEGGWAGEGGAGGMPVCEVGAVEFCYTGPEGTEGIGICRAGERFCLDGFTFSPCLGEQVPIAQSCTPDDCDDACLIPECGNGILEPGEECDDGHITCTASCSRVGVRQLEVSYFGACALLWDGDVKCWGSNHDGNLGIGDTRNRGAKWYDMGANLPTVELGTGRTAKAIAGRGLHTCALLDDDSVKCWGYNSGWLLGPGGIRHRGTEPGQMGDNLPPLDLGPGRTATSMSSSATKTCFILDNGLVRCMYSLSESGPVQYDVALGLGRTAKAIAVGDEHSCAILDDDSLKCWGANYAGQLGLEDTVNRGPSDVSNLPAVNLGTGRTATQVAVGLDFTCAILDDDSLKCWGSNHAGQLGLELLTIAVGGKTGEMGNNLPAVKLGTGRTARSVTASYGHTCAVLDDDSLKCWGRNANGALGLEDKGWMRGKYPGDMGDNLPAVNLGTGRGARAVSNGFTRTCAILDDYGVKCWGQNDTGQLGLGDTVERGLQILTMGDHLPYVELYAVPVNR